MNRYASFIATKDESNGNYEIALLSSKIFNYHFKLPTSYLIALNSTASLGRLATCGINDK